MIPPNDLNTISDLSDWYTGELIHHNTLQDDPNLPNDIQESYSQLKERAEKNSSIQTSLFVPQENIDIIKGMLVQIKNQGDYFKIIFDEIKEENSLMKISSKEKDEQIAKMSKTVTDIENSIMWKMLKRYDGFKDFFKRK